MNIDDFKNCSILVVGDLMIDEYLWGSVDRISPEAPVQVVAVDDEEYTLGGCGNVVKNLVSLGAKVCTAGVVGSDREGGLLRTRLQELSVDTEGVMEESGRCTTRKTRIIAANQHVLRIDRESRIEISEPTLQAMMKTILSKIPEVDLVLVSDYGKGVVTPDLLSHVIGTARRHGKTAIADPKGLDYRKYSGLRLLTPNKKEAAAAAGIDIRSESELIEAGNRILGAVDLDALLVTCGKEGMMLFERNLPVHKIRAEARQVYDVSGAGDTVIAVLGLALACGAPLQAAAALANTAAGIVVGKVGTAAVSPEELAAALNPYRSAAVLKQIQVSELPKLSQAFKRQGKRIVLTNGCFDLLHSGHIQLFSGSRQLGDVLVVAIDDDASVARLKGPGRPVLKEKERVQMLSALDGIDFVVVFSNGELEKVIRGLEPSVLTKGSNYTSDRVYGHELMDQIGGRVVLIPITEDISSSRIIESIKRQKPAA